MTPQSQASRAIVTAARTVWPASPIRSRLRSQYWVDTAPSAAAAPRAWTTSTRRVCAACIRQANGRICLSRSSTP
jgi:hypothetical protein